MMMSDLAKELKDAKKLLQAIRSQATATATQSAKKMAAGNIGRSEYGYHKSGLETSNEILGLMSAPQVQPPKKQKLFIGLFG